MLAAYVFLYAPIAVVVALSFNASRLSASWEGFTLAWHVKAATNPAVLQTLHNSLFVGGVATLVATVLGTGAALALHRHRFGRSGAVEATNMILPTVALGA